MAGTWGKAVAAFTDAVSPGSSPAHVTGRGGSLPFIVSSFEPGCPGARGPVRVAYERYRRPQPVCGQRAGVRHGSARHLSNVGQGGRRCRRLTVPAGAVMPDTGWVVVPLPEHISSANAEQVRKRLLWAIDRGAAVLVADLTATLSCDSAGAGALLQACQRSLAAGTELRLVVTAEAVRRALRLGGLTHLALMFPTPGAALADLRESRRQPGQVLKITAMPPEPPGAGEPGDAPQADAALLDSAVGRLSDVALRLHDTAGLSPERIDGVLDNLDDAIRDIREYALAVNRQGPQPGTAAGPPPDISERVAQNAEHTAALRRQLTVTARALHLASAEAAALMAQRRSPVEQPQRIDYPVQVKRWQTIADTAQHMAEIYEHA